MTIESKEIQINEHLSIGGKSSLFLIGGPCVIENEGHSVHMAGQINAPATISGFGVWQGVCLMCEPVEAKPETKSTVSPG